MGYFQGMQISATQSVLHLFHCHSSNSVEERQRLLIFSHLDSASTGVVVRPRLWQSCCVRFSVPLGCWGTAAKRNLTYESNKLFSWEFPLTSVFIDLIYKLQLLKQFNVYFVGNNNQMSSKNTEYVQPCSQSSLTDMLSHQALYLHEVLGQLFFTYP